MPSFASGCTGMALLGMSALASGCSTPAPAAKTDATELPISCTSPLARDYLLQAMDLADARKPADALRLLERAHAVDPDCVIVDAWRGWLLSGEERVRVLESVVSRSSSLPPGEQKLVEMIVATCEGDPARALSAIEEVSRIVPNSWRAHQIYARRLAGANRNGEALVELRDAIRLAPEQPMAWLQLAQIDSELGRYGEAADASVKYAEAMPENSVAFEVASFDLLTASREDDSERFARRAIELNPRSARGWRLVGRVRTLKSDHVEARTAITKALEFGRDPELVERTRLDSALLSWLEGDKAGSASLFGRIREGFKGDVFARFHAGTGAAMLATLMCLDGDCEGALPVLDRVGADIEKLIFEKDRGLTSRLKFFERRARLAILARSGRIDEAAALARSTAQEPDDWHTALAAFGNGEILRARGDRAAAEAAYAECSGEAWCLYELSELRRLRRDSAGTADALARLEHLEALDLMGVYLRVRGPAAAESR